MLYKPIFGCWWYHLKIRELRKCNSFSFLIGAHRHSARVFQIFYKFGMTGRLTAPKDAADHRFTVFPGLRQTIPGGRIGPRNGLCRAYSSISGRRVHTGIRPMKIETKSPRHRPFRCRSGCFRCFMQQIIYFCMF